MSRNKQTRRPAEARTSAPADIHPQWLWVTLVAGLTFGAAFGFFVGQAVSTGGSLPLDSYGRAPSHAHYNHDHP